jgi:23S rRNA (cytidine1920-2'-O)/16S rRNA (cytidine1409-2'-O)-methyltransferase
MPAAARLRRRDADVIALVKPQFEAGRGATARGVIRSPVVWHSVLRDLATALAVHGWNMQNLVVSPIRGAAGNVEFLAHLRFDVAGPELEPLLRRALDAALAL